MRRHGMIVAFEGIDGTGKTTQIRMLAKFLRSMNIDCIETREPTDGQHGRQAREILAKEDQPNSSELLDLFLKDRRQHARDLIIPAMEQGKLVLTDRYKMSSAACQGSSGQDPKSVMEAQKDIPDPDVVILLSIHPSLAMKRASARGKLDACENLTRLEEVAAAYAACASLAKMNGECVKTVDASKSINKVQQEVRRVLLPLLFSKGFIEQQC